MNYQNYPHYDPWNQNEYRTGSTKPPKRHGGLIAVLLVIVILLSGVVSILGVMNVRLFKQLHLEEAEQDLPIMFSNPDDNVDPSMETVAATTSAQEDTKPSIHAQPSPTSQENVPLEGALSLQAIYEKVIPSVVSITSYYSRGSSTGTGVIFSEDGYIVTNCHVVEDAQRYDVLLTDGRILDAILVGTDEISDLAVLQIEGDNLIAAVFGDSSVLRVGDTVVAIGDPLGIELRGTMTDGIVSAINRDIDVEGRTMSLIQTNAALNSGNSGGPLINCYGQVIGINTMKMGDSMSIAGVEGLGFAIPSTTVTDIVNQLITNGYVSGRPTLGITGESISSFYQFYYNLPQGLYINSVEPGSSADRVGIQPGDILISLNDVAVTSMDALKSVIYSYKPGDTVEILIYRGGRQYTATLVVDEANNE